MTGKTKSRITSPYVIRAITGSPNAVAVILVRSTHVSAVTNARNIPANAVRNAVRRDAVVVQSVRHTLVNAVMSADSRTVTAAAAAVVILILVNAAMNVEKQIAAVAGRAIHTLASAAGHVMIIHAGAVQGAIRIHVSAVTIAASRIGIVVVKYSGRYVSWFKRARWVHEL
ncbi:hypothetical protein [Bacillus sp. P14.5]|uniref:hypothetical protein n=1 Tax=Bacillus sp. P14.5 TaxID=1983400 RepID=UPI000DE9FA2D|nr:hypothetical protein [Bacillus sp. P14.5]